MWQPRLRDFAAMADICYGSSDVKAENFTRVHFRELPSGFKGSRFRLASGPEVVNVIAFAGTDTGDFLDAVTDIVADLGFAGGALSTTIFSVPNPLSKLLGTTLMAGRGLLESQIMDAMFFVKETSDTSRPGEKLFVTGHSLGGGLAQIISCLAGIPGVAFNAPSVSQLGVSQQLGVRFLNMMDSGDLISIGSRVLGKHIEAVEEVRSGTYFPKSHKMLTMKAYLTAGHGTKRGEETPFSP